MVSIRDQGHIAADSVAGDSMTMQNPHRPRARILPAGFVFLAITSIGWGFTWPVLKYLLGELPPLTLRLT